MIKEIKQFIEENLNLITQNTKESWEEIYEKIPDSLKGQFTETMLVANIDPASILGYLPNQYLFRSSIQQYTIPNTVTTIGDYAFFGCSNLTSITIPDSVTSIGYRAFIGCYSLTDVTIGNGLTSISSGAFEDCVKLASITIPNSVTSIGERTFRYCTSLIEVTIPNSVTSIGNYAFNGCTSLTSITIPNSVTRIGTAAFWYCENLIEINYLGTKKEARTILRVRNKNWRESSAITKIICTDGIIEL